MIIHSRLDLIETNDLRPLRIKRQSHYNASRDTMSSNNFFKYHHFQKWHLHEIFSKESRITDFKQMFSENTEFIKSRNSPAELIRLCEMNKHKQPSGKK